MKIKLTNTTLSDIEFSFGETIEAGATVDISHLPSTFLAQCSDLTADLLNGSVVLNNGEINLSPQDAISYINGSLVLYKTEEFNSENLFPGDTLLWSPDGWNVCSKRFDIVSAKSSSACLPSSSPPTITSGSSLWSATFPAHNALHKIKITYNIQAEFTSHHWWDNLFGIALFCDNTLIGGSVESGSENGRYREKHTVLTNTVLYSPGDTEDRVYSMRCGMLSSGHWSVGNSSCVQWGPAFENSSSVQIEEVLI